MIYEFAGFELDVDAAELRAAGALVPVERQVFDVLKLLIEQRDRLVSRDELIEKIWSGRFISDAAVSSRIKSVRRALGDDGRSQRFVRTLHKRGFRFVAPVTLRSPHILPVHAAIAEAPAEERPDPAILAGKPSIAVLPFRVQSGEAAQTGLGDAIPQELISALSRLRWLFVIARASSFHFHEAAPDMQEIGRVLGVRYGLTGALEFEADSLTADLELTDMRDGGVVWADRLTVGRDLVHELREEIVRRVVGALEIYIPLNEVQHIQHSTSENLDAWASYHLGLQHMYRFTRSDNQSAETHFHRAAKLDANFARARAALSFTHFQNAFMRYTPDPSADMLAARSFAERGIELDPLDPFTNLSMGRSFWLEGRHGDSLPWLERATSINPNYAQGHYSRAFAAVFSPDAGDVHQEADVAARLSPLDPLLYGMRGAHALAYIVAGDYEKAAAWADAAARSPAAHVIIMLIAVVAHGLNEDDISAGRWATRIREIRSDANQALFFGSIPIADAVARQKAGAALARFGF